MKAVRVHRWGLSDPMRVDEVEDPSPGPGELLVKAAAAGLLESTGQLVQG